MQAKESAIFEIQNQVNEINSLLKRAASSDDFEAVTRLSIKRKQLVKKLKNVQSLSKREDGSGDIQSFFKDNIGRDCPVNKNDSSPCSKPIELNRVCNRGRSALMYAANIIHPVGKTFSI